MTRDGLLRSLLGDTDHRQDPDEERSDPSAPAGTTNDAQEPPRANVHQPETRAPSPSAPADEDSRTSKAPSAPVSTPAPEPAAAAPTEREGRRRRWFRSQEPSGFRYDDRPEPSEEPVTAAGGRAHGAPSSAAPAEDGSDRPVGLLWSLLGMLEEPLDPAQPPAAADEAATVATEAPERTPHVRHTPADEGDEDPAQPQVQIHRFSEDDEPGDTAADGAEDHTPTTITQPRVLDRDEPASVEPPPLGAEPGSAEEPAATVPTTPAPTATERPERGPSTDAAPVEATVAPQAPAPVAGAAPADVPAPAERPTPRAPAPTSGTAAPPAGSDLPEDLLAALTSFDIDRRRRALRGLLVTQLTEPMVRAAASSLQDPETELRYLALQVLERAPELVPTDALANAALDADPGLRARVVQLAGRSADLGVLPLLHDRLAHETDATVLANGVVALGNLARATGPEATSQDDYDRMLGAVGSLPTTATPGLQRALATFARTLPEGEILHRLGAAAEDVRHGAGLLALHASHATRRTLARLVADEDAGMRRLAMQAVAQGHGHDVLAPTAEAETAPRQPGAQRHPATHVDVPSEQVTRATEDEVQSALLPGLVEALADPQPDIRHQAANALELVPRERLVGYLRARTRVAPGDELLRLITVVHRVEADDVVGELADAAMRLEAGEGREAVLSALRDMPAVRDLLERRGEDENPTERIAALRLRALLHPRDTAAIRDGLTDPNAEVRLAAIRTAAARLDDELAELLTHTMLRDGSARVRAAALQAFRASAPWERISAARAALDSLHPDLRVAALGLLAGDSDEEFDAVASALRDRHPDVVRTAAEMLAETRAAEAITLLWTDLRTITGANRELILEVLYTVDPQALERLAHRAIDSREPTERAVGLAALAAIGDPSMVSRLTEALADPSIDVRLEALEALRQHPSAMSIAPALGALRDPEPEVRAASLRVLAAVEDEEAYAHLIDALDDPAEVVRRAARRAIVSQPSPALVDVLIGELERPAHRGVAVEMLADLGEVAHVKLLEALPNADPETTTAILVALRGSDVGARLLEDLEDRRPQRRAAALEILRTLGHEDAVEPAIARLRDPDPQVRIQAARFLGDLADPRARAALQSAFASDPDMQVVAAIESAFRRLHDA